jgi:hypothetical protein
MIYKPFIFLFINAINIKAYSFVGLFITGVFKSLVGLLNNIIDIIIESDLTKK